MKHSDFLPRDLESKSCFFNQFFDSRLTSNKITLSQISMDKVSKGENDKISAAQFKSLIFCKGAEAYK